MTGKGLSWAEGLALWAYGVIMRALQPLLRRKLHRRGQQEPGYLAHMPERFGFYDGSPPEPGRVWVHAVSLGETRAAAILIGALRDVWPDMRLLLTHSTATGRAQGQSLLRPGDAQAWLPWDTPEATRQFLQHHRPRLGILMETEVWPMLVQACVQAQLPLVLANARLNDKSLRLGLRWSLLSGPAYRGLRAVWAQSPEDAARLGQLGAQVQGVLGNLKFDVQPQPEALASAQHLRRQWQHDGKARPVVMLASSREGEEAMWLDALFQDAKRLADFRRAGVLWLLVPRHPQRFKTVHELLRFKNLSVLRRTALSLLSVSEEQTVSAPANEVGQVGGMGASEKSEQFEKPEHCDVLLGDSLGEMPLYFQAADMALLGGSFLPLGGQNLIEAIAFGCPIIMGPHTFNFPEAAQKAETAGAAVRVGNMDQALDQVKAWLDQPKELASARQQGLVLIAKSQGSASRYAQAVRDSVLSIQ